MKFTYIKTPLHRYTFKAPKIKEWVENNVEGYVLNLFAGITKLNCNEVRNDIDPYARAEYHIDALEFIKSWKGNKFDTILLDPPYQIRKSMEKYGGRIMSPFNAIKDSIPSILNKNSIVITFGYHSVAMGQSRGFYQEHICLMSHGGAIHDTIATIERYKEIQIN
jgi:hypothetical protein